MFRKFVAHPAFAVGSTVLWGLVEWIALTRSRHVPREPSQRQP